MQCSVGSTLAGRAAPCFRIKLQAVGQRQRAAQKSAKGQKYHRRPGSRGMYHETVGPHGSLRSHIHLRRRCCGQGARTPHDPAGSGRYLTTILTAGNNGSKPTAITCSLATQPWSCSHVPSVEPSSKAEISRDHALCSARKVCARIDDRHSSIHRLPLCTGRITETNGVVSAGSSAEHEAICSEMLVSHNLSHDSIHNDDSQMRSEPSYM